MSKYVPDISSSRWVIIADSRENRPDEMNGDLKPGGKCPFCEGNEKMTPAEVYRVGNGNPGEPGWEVRVFPNRYPITDFHEVIVHAPSEEDLHQLPLAHIEKVFQTYRQRFNEYRKKGQVMIFCNRGEHAGASMIHPHSQLVVIPNQINLSTLNCEPLGNLVEENTYFNIYCPDFSQWPYEVWIASKVKNTFFGDITNEEIRDLVDIYVRILDRLENLYESKNRTSHDFSYNFYIYPKEM
ncbi:MAG: Galactose-1-phosphate uridylyltransferase [Candidatus Roizmanbacteria bacterium GW2011_GWA2_37_7]|uniref:Galactose-1-phosphate uridylyltransferase n=1 Tax=Candidatus Roizmanbacteria bacterium GW2011_GWA2_37_7 TaxID=1618481 RepID=A0A0G0GZX9_9BACT|nr:MAG: Galactose-1-phosphate uridylyltransferase [Candidatus Roizmanbacteria bacterium GW2011_GWA2_37_7]